MLAVERSERLRELLTGPRLVRVAGAHDALSACLIEKAGFDAVWATGFGMSAAQLGNVDANLLTMTENLEIVRRIVGATTLPVIADCDNGYGNAINVMRTVAEFEAAGVAGICIEDNIFPKRCSFYPGVRRELVSLEEHAGKIRAAKAAQRTPGFVVISRSEALIAGWGMEEAVRRAQAYAAAGADSLFVHSKAPTFEESRELARRVASLSCPLVIVPTTFPQVTPEELEAAGFRMVIFANHALRAALRAMEETLRLIQREGRTDVVSSRIASLQEVYDIVGVSELQENERQFLPPGGEAVTAIILAAGFEKELLPLIKDKPRAMLEVRGKTILERQMAHLNACGIRDIVVVRGYKREAITYPQIRYYDNEAFEDSHILSSLFCAEPEIRGRCILLYGDILFDRAALEKLLRAPGDIVMAVDRAWPDEYRAGLIPADKRADLVITSRPPAPGYRFLPAERESRVLRIGQRIRPEEAHGEFIGMMMVSERGAEILRERYAAAVARGRDLPFQEAPSLARASLTDLVQEIIDGGEPVSSVDLYKGWMEVNTFEDYQRAWADLTE